MRCTRTVIRKKNATQRCTLRLKKGLTISPIPSKAKMIKVTNAAKPDNRAIVQPVPKDRYDKPCRIEKPRPNMPVDMCNGLTSRIARDNQYLTARGNVMNFLVSIHHSKPCKAEKKINPSPTQPAKRKFEARPGPGIGNISHIPTIIIPTRRYKAMLLPYVSIHTKNFSILNEILGPFASIITASRHSAYCRFSVRPFRLWTASHFTKVILLFQLFNKIVLFPFFGALLQDIRTLTYLLDNGFTS